MAIPCRNLLGAAILIGATTLVTSQVVSRQDEPGANQEEMMKQWMALAQPGEEHARLATLAGTWSNVNSHTMYPGAEPEKSTSKAVLTSVLGGRFLTEHVTGEFAFQGEKIDFEGMGLFGFDNLKQKHFFAWVDNLGTMMMVAEGTTDAKGNIVYHSTMPDPMSGADKSIKSVLTFTSESEHTFEMYEKLPDGTWFKNMQIDAKRTY